MASRGTTDKHVEMARHFLFGQPGIKGDWREAASAAGFTGRSPNRTSEAMQVALNLVKKEAEQGLVDTMQRPDPDMDRMTDLVASDDPPWTEIAVLAKRVLARIAAGKTEANANQVAAIKEIIGRAEGRIGQKSEVETDAKSFVVVLPALHPYSEDAVVDLSVTDILRIEEGGLA